MKRKYIQVTRLKMKPNMVKNGKKKKTCNIHD